MRRLAPVLMAVLAALLLVACASAPGSYAPAPQQPEAASAITAKPGWATRHTAVAAANPLATEAGHRILRAGGSAVDAAIAVQMVLGLVEPQSSGIGGGAFLLHFDGRKVQAWDGRETAPAAADERLFLDTRDQPLPFYEAAVGGRAVGVPGAVRMLEAAHRVHGRLPWRALFEPAIALAEQGFGVSPRLHALLAAETHLQKDPVAARFFYDAAGRPLAVGTQLKNPEYAAVLRQIAASGARGLLEGDVARAMVAAVQGHPGNPGRLTLADLSGYQARERAPLCFDHTARGRPYQVCGMPPPSSGTLATAQILGLLERAPFTGQPTADALPTPQWLHYYTEAARLALADRAQYVADPDFVTPPAGRWTSLLDSDYLSQRARALGPVRMPTVLPGRPGGAPSAHAPAADQPEYGTSHISIVDGYGNALAMTTTIEDAFGARLMVNRGLGLEGGFLLNNELTDFSFEPRGADGRPVANRVEGGKRPRSSMSPTLVLDRASGQLVMTLGSPGGAVIIHYTTKVLLGVLHWGMDAQQAISMPNFGVPGGPLLLEEQQFPASTLEQLRALGHTVRETALTSGLQAIQRTPQGWFGGADPRREGIVLGD